nr:unnamed protein product [Callosobruchus chinensis]
MQSRDGEFDTIGGPALTCHFQPLSHQRAIGDLSLFYQYSNGFCSSELTSMVPPHFKPARCTRGTSSSHPRALSSRSTLVFRPCLRDLLSYKKIVEWISA